MRLYDTATRSTRPLVPIRDGHVGIYVCGATVQGSPHIGHLRADVAYDVLVRWLRRTGHEVTYVRNVTDIDDKILARSAEAGVPWWAWALRHEREFTAAYAAIGNLPPTYEPRATGHVPDMVELMERLVERGHAYATGGGDVWFDVRSWPDYGSLTNQRPEDIAESPDEGSVKRDPRDFALWKAVKPGEPETASWATPYGRGRPGWHLECSAMARRYLGDAFDIHGGGIDLRFPHHENEQAQSRAAGYDFARLWVHSAWVTQGGEKMSKSLGNSLLVANVLAEVPAPVLRYALASVHYRAMLDWGPEVAAEAEATWSRLSGFVRRAAERVPSPDPATVELPAAFAEAMDDDLNVSAALAVVHEHVRRGNTALADGLLPEVGEQLGAVRAMLDVLGLDPLRWRTDDGAAGRRTIEVLVEAALEDRAEARRARDWARADAIRDRLAAAGVVVEDGPTGSRWTLAEEDV